METHFVSLCILAYKRPDKLMACLDSLHETIDYPCEIIVNVDGEDNQDQQSSQVAHEYFRQKKISKLITIGGENRGVGRSFQNCLGLAEGDLLFKIDTDLTFEKGWLSRAVQILTDNTDIGTLSLFNYNHYDPNDERFKILSERPDCYIVNDFVSSIFGFRRSDLLWCSLADDPIPDDGLHQQIGGKLAITKEDLVKNSGFGRNSTYVSFDENDKPFKTKTHDSPLIFS